MLREHVRDMESELGQLLTDVLPASQRWHWTFEGYAQGLLLHFLESFGFTTQVLPALACQPADGNQEVLAGWCFTSVNGGRTFSAYHPDLGVALVMAALMALRARARPDASLRQQLDRVAS
jgi:hypothetical protein